MRNNQTIGKLITSDIAQFLFEIHTQIFRVNNQFITDWLISTIELSYAPNEWYWSKSNFFLVGVW